MSKAIFNVGISNKLKRNAFNLSHSKVLSCNMATLVPILCEEVVPGDSWRIKTEFLLRMAPLVSPVMHRIDVFTHFFFVPNRLIWEDWEDFITGGEDGDDASVSPYVNYNAANSLIAEGTLADYLGLQHDLDSVPNTGTFSILPFRAYHKIWNEYYRDQNLQDPVALTLSSGDCSTEFANYLSGLNGRCWQKDYFTAALPWTQKGDEVILPLGSTAPIEFDTTNDFFHRVRRTADSTRYANSTTADEAVSVADGASQAYQTLWRGAPGSLTEEIAIDLENSHYTDLSSATAATINDLRAALHVQRWMERNARAGSRYVEYILAHFGVKSSDARLQRPEFLGGGKSPITISEVLQNSQTDTTPQGTLTGHALSVGVTHKATKFFEEHGYIIGIMSVMPKPMYAQGVRKHLLKADKFEYYHPEFAHLGEQEVYDRELYNAAAVSTSSVFGYQPRYCEYKYIPDTIHGQMRDDLLYWTLVRDFASAPSLNEDFVKANDISHRIFADTDTGNHKLYINLYHDIQAIRPMPVFSNPGL